MEFTAGQARIVICPSCSTVVARKDGGLEAQGKALPIVDTDSPLSLRLDGRHAGNPFVIVGRIQKDHGAGPWDEWYLAFDDGREAWLSESEGAWHIMFPAGKVTNYKIGNLRPTSRIRIKDREFVVEEIGTATTVTAEGQLPNDFDANVTHEYVDVTGVRGTFATLDFGTTEDQADVYVGHKVTLDELQFDKNALAPRVRRIQLQQARCTQCNGPLELKAPDQTMRVACPFCGALLDASQGKLAFLQQLKKPDRAPTIPLGAKGSLFGVEWINIAFLVRSCKVEGRRYPWEEYLLFNKERGFRWLMMQNGHWSFLTPIAAGDVTDVGGNVIHDGKRYRLFQQVGATTESVQGECYWAVEPGEFATAAEWVSPPHSINRDMTQSEVTYTFSEYVEPEVIRQAFKLKVVPYQQGISPNQPNPHAIKARAGLKWAAIYSSAIFMLYLVFSAMAAGKIVYDGVVSVPGTAMSGTPEAMTFSQPFEITSNGNLEVTVSAAPLSNDWAGLEIDFVNEATGEVVGSYQEVSYYHGYDSDGSWSEGSTSDTEHISSVDKGRYVARFVPYFGATRPTYTVKVKSDVPRFLWVLLAWMALFTWPIIRAIRSSSFESTRWSESTVGQ